MPAILFGSMSTLVDTSELQRAAFNAAFGEHDLGWTWDREQYAALLDSSGGAQRIADHAAALGQQLDAEAVHQTKSELFLRGLGSSELPLRPGVADTVREAREGGIALALVTTTSAENVAALLAAVTPRLGGFDVVVDASAVEHAKPDPAAYRYTVERLNGEASACVAVEDNLGGVQSARAAGTACVASRRSRRSTTTPGPPYGVTGFAMSVVTSILTTTPDGGATTPDGFGELLAGGPLLRWLS